MTREPVYVLTADGKRCVALLPSFSQAMRKLSGYPLGARVVRVRDRQVLARRPDHAVMKGVARGY